MGGLDLGDPSRLTFRFLFSRDGLVMSFAIMPIVGL